MAETIATGKNAPNIPVLLRRFAESELAKKNKYVKNWDATKKMYDGDHWYDSTKVAWFQSEPTMNKVFEFIEIMRSYLADNKWGLDVFPAIIPEDMSKAIEDVSKRVPDPQMQQTQALVGAEIGFQLNDMMEKINKLLDFIWVDQRTQNKLAQVLLYVFMYGTGFLKTTFNGTNIGDTGIGQIETRAVSPRYMYPDPAATCVQDCSYLMERHPVTFRWIIERYPEKAWEVREKGLGSDDEYHERGGDAGIGAPNAEEGKRVDVIEAYYIDSSIVEDETEETGYKLAYPNGRCTIFTKSGVILEDYENKYTTFPYVRFIEIPRPGEFWGDATVWRALSIQKTINTLLRAIIDNGLWLTHGIWVADTTSGVTPKKLAGYGPRDVVLKNPGTEVRRDSGAPLPSHLFETLNQQVEAFDRVVGLPDVLRGIVPSRTPVGTIQMQKEAGDVRTRERARRVEESLEDLGRLWLDIVKNHWADKRSVSGKGVTGGLEMFQMSKADLEEWDFSLHVIPGSTTPFDTDGMVEKVIRMRTEAGMAIPDSYIAELSRLPGLVNALNEEQERLREEATAAPSQPETEPATPQSEMGATNPLEGMMPGMEQGLPDISQMPETMAALQEGAGEGMIPEELPM